MLSQAAFHFEYSSVIPASREKVWEFHERPDAIERLTPPGQRVQVISRSGGLEAGAEVVFRVYLLGPISIRWVARHTACERYRQFTDEQIEGPFRYWHHVHEFETHGDGMRLTDRISFDVFGGPPAAWLVRRQLTSMFQHRHEVTRAAAAAL